MIFCAPQHSSKLYFSPPESGDMLKKKTLNDVRNAARDLAINSEFAETRFNGQRLWLTVLPDFTR